MKHLMVSIQVAEEEQELVIARLSELEVTGFEQQPETLLAYFEADTFDQPALEKLLLPLAYNVELVEDQNWNAVWESNFDPVIVPGFCGVRAHFHAPLEGVAHEIIITPKMSFGTGHHATTYMMMEHMSRMTWQDKRVFDFGTGTGLLAILAEKLGASSVDAIDIDEWSVTNALENLTNNACTKIDVVQSTIIPERTYDIILANINRNIILEYIPNLSARLNNKGEILFSGLLVEDEAVIQAAAEKQGLIFFRKEERTNWISLLFAKETLALLSKRTLTIAPQYAHFIFTTF